ncbi:probable sucrose-phosphate synthase [Rosa chinensis]|uniref:probable sucrose-phosphate synthase n=1 Tax=Rosa chinensis TaxID=74649 RepID=UPI001AD94DE2|nr:probable sucrose-phosphate synthase [Rosa chinensis]
MILALARADPKKNITTLVKAFGECRPLRDLSNLTLIMGNRDDIDEMSSTNASVLLSILKLIDRYDLYGHVAYPKHHKQSDVPDIYRLAAKTKVLLSVNSNLKWERRGKATYTQEDIDVVRNEWAKFMVKTYIEDRSDPSTDEEEYSSTGVDESA